MFVIGKNNIIIRLYMFGFKNVKCSKLGQNNVYTMTVAPLPVYKCCTKKSNNIANNIQMPNKK